MFIDYVNDKSLDGIKKQHNIMVFIGNGFDISLLSKYRKDKLVSSYSKFYDYLCYKGFNASNVLFQKMAEDKKNGKENWSDFENSLGELIQVGIPPQDLYNALREIQNMFLLFLNEIVSPEILLQVNKKAEVNQWGINALSRFLGDLDEKDYDLIAFPEETYHYDMYNYLFVNFNYTSLFDNYIYLDRGQFDPHKHKTVPTNFSFMPNPNGYNKTGCDERTVWSSLIMTDTIHPHGYQNIPRSLLFGIEDEAYKDDRKLNKFNKSYWAQNNLKYKKYFDDARLFIIYGTSLGKTDSWWWKNVYNSLLNTNSELIIYYYNNCSCDQEYVKELFINTCADSLDKDEVQKVKSKIFVVLYTNSRDHNMFQLEDSSL